MILHVEICNFCYDLNLKRMKNRSDYEKDLEIIVNKIKSGLKEVEDKALKAKESAKTGLKDIETKIKTLTIQREQIDKKFDELKNTSKEKWDKMLIDFERFLETFQSEKQNFSVKAESLMHDFSIHFKELEEKLKEMRESPDESWQKVKSGFEEKLDQAKKSISQAIDNLKKK